MPEQPAINEESDECCGAHAVCEKETLLNSGNNIEYYDDEELDLYAGRSSASYEENEAARFRYVFDTLQEDDVAGWLRSLQLRNIELPEDIREEALFIVKERRFQKSK